jgi:hypothetical protein
MVRHMLNRTEYLLIKLAEEAVEVAQRADKALIFSLEQVQQNVEQNPEGLNNAERLLGEVYDLFGVLEMLFEEGIIARPTDQDWLIAVRAKRAKVEKYMAISRERGCLELA